MASKSKNNIQGGLNPLQYKNLKNQQKNANVALDSGAVATLPNFEQPTDRRGPFDMGLLATWIVYIILGVVFVMSLIGVICFSVMLTNTFSGVAASKNQPLKFFGIVLSSTVFTSTGILLGCFCIQHAKEAGWLPSPESPSEKEDEQNLAQNAKINALYSIDPGLQHPQTPVTPSMVNPRAPLIVY